MRIALLGAPGSGKTKIARRIVRRLNAEYHDGDDRWVVIDGYVDRLRKRTGLNYGAESSMRENLQVLGERWLVEDETARKGEHSITCGSIYENIIYGAVESMAIPFLENEQQILDETRIAQTFMNLLGYLERRYFNYDALFYLPLGNEEDHTWDSVIDNKLPEILEGFFRYAVRLEGTDKQKVMYATDIIKGIHSALYSDNREGILTPPEDLSG